jgi:ketosteroid isomerase-like protein
MLCSEGTAIIQRRFRVALSFPGERRDYIRVVADKLAAVLGLVPGPLLLSRGLDAYIATWEKFLSWSEKPVAFDFHDVKVTAGKDVAFATAIGRCAGVNAVGKREDVEFRLTMGLQKIGGRWRIMHEHHSVPAD